MKKPLNPIVFHVISTTASAGAPIKKDWRILAALHSAMVQMRHLGFMRAAA